VTQSIFFIELSLYINLLNIQGGMGMEEQKCELLEKCGFFAKYTNTKELACKGFMNQYCNGSKMNQCKRKEFRQKHGVPPSDDMMPSGQFIKQN